MHKLQVVCASQSKPLPSSSTAAYCQARAHLELTSLEHTFEVGDIFHEGKGFCSYDDVWAFPTQGVDSVITLARRTPVTEAESVKVLGDNDRLIRWPKPVHRQVANYSHAQWADSPDSLLLRQIKVTVEQPGFRVTTFYIITTLLDPRVYPASEIAELYLQRGDVELFFRDIKTTMGMDVLRCKTPAVVRKEILLTFIAYNGIRRLVSQAAREQNVPLRRLSFKGSIEALRHGETHLTGTKNNCAE